MNREELARAMDIVRRTTAGGARASASWEVSAARRLIAEAGFDPDGVTTAAAHEEIDDRMGIKRGPTAPYSVRCTRYFPVVTRAAARAFLASSDDPRKRTWPKSTAMASLEKRAVEPINASAELEPIETIRVYGSATPFEQIK